MSRYKALKIARRLASRGRDVQHIRACLIRLGCDDREVGCNAALKAVREVEHA